jgi:hypothetical protein
MPPNIFFSVTRAIGASAALTLSVRMGDGGIAVLTLDTGTGGASAFTSARRRV